MAHVEYRIAIVVDQAFDCFTELSTRMHVWACASSTDLRFAEGIWAAHPGYSMKCGVTTFDFNASASSEQTLVGIPGTVDLHHGPYSHDPPWTVLEVYGAAPTAEVAAALRAYGVQRIDKTEGGFAAFRKTAAAV